MHNARPDPFQAYTRRRQISPSTYEDRTADPITQPAITRDCEDSTVVQRAYLTATCP